MMYSRDEFVEFETLHGMFVFIYESKCPLCKMHIQSLYNHNILDFCIIYLETDEEVEWLEKRFDIQGVPHTAVYKHNKLIWHKNNLFFKRQIKELNIQLDILNE